MWIESKVADWTNAIADLAFVALSHPQSAYAGLQKSLQMEWQFVQRVVKGIGDDFSENEKSIDDLFLPALFSDKLEDHDARHFLRKLPMKFSGLGLPDPAASSKSNLEASTLVCSHLLAAFRSLETFSPAKHQSVRQTVMAELKVRRTALNKSTLDSLLKDLDCDTRRTLL
jgi:hypothetical protein